MKRLFIVVLALLGLAQMAAAIPAFSKKTGYSCQVCHDPVPHLNAAGEKFMANGFKLTGDERPQGTVDTGDPLLSLPMDIPLSLRVDTYMSYSPNGPTTPALHTPSALQFRLVRQDHQRRLITRRRLVPTANMDSKDRPSNDIRRIPK